MRTTYRQGGPLRCEAFPYVSKVYLSEEPADARYCRALVGPEKAAPPVKVTLRPRLQTSEPLIEGFSERRGATSGGGTHDRSPASLSTSPLHPTD